MANKISKIEILMDGRPLTEKAFKKAIMDTRVGNYADRKRYMDKINRQISVLTKLSQEIVLNIKRDQLSGQKLNKKSGKLQNSIKFRLVNNKSSGLQSDIYTDSKLTTLYEDGGSGVVIVKAHDERRTKVFNKIVPIYTRHVPEHSRRYNFRGLKFMRTEVEKSRPKIIQKLVDSFLKD